MAADLFSFASVELSRLRALSYPAGSVSRRRVSSKFPAFWIRISCSNIPRRSISCGLSEPTPVSDPSDSSASSSGPDFGLVSTSACSDGSTVFHFGDVIETARPGIEETKLNDGQLYEVASEGLPNEDLKEISALEVVPDKDNKGEISEVTDIIGPEVSAPSDSSASSTFGPDFGLVSTSVCSDGSTVFHFGYVSDTARPGIEEIEVNDNGQLYEVASEGLPNEEDSKEISALEEVPDKDKGEISEVADIIGPEVVLDKEETAVPNVNMHEENIELEVIIDKGKEELKVTSRSNSDEVDAKSLFSEDKLELSSSEDINSVLALEEAQNQEKGTTISSSISEVVAEGLSSSGTGRISTTDVLEEETAHVDDSNRTAELEEVADNGSTSVDDSAVATELLDSSLGLEATSQSPEPSTTPVSVSSSTVLEVGFDSNAEGSSSLEELLQEKTTPLEGGPTATSDGPEMAASEEEEVLQAKAVDEIEPINLEDLSQSETPDEGEEISQEKAGDENISLESKVKITENVTEVMKEHSADTSIKTSTSKYCEEPEKLQAFTSAEAVLSGDEQVRDNTVAATLKMDATTLDNGVISNQEAVEDGEESNDIAELLVSSVLQSQSGDVIPEREETVLMTEFSLSSGAASLPHPSKALTGGEDGYFIVGKNWVGVADGAGHWSLEGTNDGLFAKELMKNIKAILSDSKISPVTDPVDVLVRSAAETDAVGKSTVLVAHLDGQVLNAANIGDSGFIIIRNGTDLKRSVPMVHGLNFPMQIGKGDDPSEFVECYRIELDLNDVIVSATDGLFDNLYDEQIASIVRKSLQAGLSPQEIAEVLVTGAEKAARSESAPSPFSDSAQAAGYVGCAGWKLDDITVIVSVVGTKD